MNNDLYIELESKTGIQFSDRKLLHQAFIHRSYLNENRSLKLEHNERLEFLGDAVIELTTTEYLFHKYQQPEGILTSWRSSIVRGKSLSEEAKVMGLDKLLLTSRGESKNIGKAKDLLLANVFEALCGAIYLEKGYKVAYEFVEKFLLYKLDDMLKEGQHIDPKGRLQEITQEKIGITPSYKVITEDGPDHNKQFTVGLMLNNKQISTGTGSSKQIAQTDAASAALESIDEIIKNY